MTRVEENREYLWRMDPIAPREANQDQSGVVDDEWAADVSGVEDGSISSADIELRGANGAHRRKHVLGQTQSNAELHISPPSREDTRGRAVKPVLTDEIALDQAALDAKQLAASHERMEAIARQLAQEAHAADVRDVHEEQRVVQTQTATSSQSRRPRKTPHASVPMRARSQATSRPQSPSRMRPQLMSEEDTAPEAPALKPALRGRR